MKSGYGDDYMIEIWIVEDDRSISNLLKVSLNSEGYLCHCLFDGGEAANRLENDHRPDIILLDIMLPKIDGYDLLTYIQPLKIPVIFITAKDSIEDRIKGLRLGADDYIVKPFQLGEVIARIEAVLRRSQNTEKTILIDDVMIDLSARSVRKNGVDVPMTTKEFDLLVMLYKNKNIALYRERLYEQIWNEPFMGETRTLDSHIQRLRKKLDWNDRIKTVFRIGYRLEI